MDIEAKRKHLLKQMLELRSMRRGTLNEQRLPRTLGGKATGELRDPYYILSRRVNGKTNSVRVTRAEVQRVREDLANAEHFDALCEEFAQLTEMLGKREQADAQEAQKKKPKSRKRARTK